jgi:hypothetical protein
MKAARNGNDRPLDNREGLALWISQRASAFAEYKRVLNERENDLLALSEAKGTRSAANKDAERQLHDARVEYGQIKGVIRRPLNRLNVRWRYFAAFALGLAILEAPVNKFLFDIALQGSPFVSFSVSIAVAFFLLIMAHLAGKCLRQVWGEYRRKVIWSNVFIFLAATLGVATVICILTVGRAATSNAAMISGFGDLFSVVSNKIGALGLWGTLSHAFSDISSLILATVNLGGVSAALLLAYFTHDPDKDFDVAATELEHCRATVGKLHATFLKERNRIVGGFKPDLTGISHKHGNANKNVIEFKTRLGLNLDDEDRIVIDELDRLAEDSEHAEETGIAEAPAPEEFRPAGGVREFPRRAAS